LYGLFCNESLTFKVRVRVRVRVKAGRRESKTCSHITGDHRRHSRLTWRQQQKKKKIRKKINRHTPIRPPPAPAPAKRVAAKEAGGMALVCDTFPN
jgi:hypothetical protein